VRPYSEPWISNWGEFVEAAKSSRSGGIEYLRHKVAASYPYRLLQEESV